MTEKLDPTTWIDRQREAGEARVNIFDQILAAAKSIRAGQTKTADYAVERRVDRVHQIRRDAALFDRAVDPLGGVASVQTLDGEIVRTTGMMQRWSFLR